MQVTVSLKDALRERPSDAYRLASGASREVVPYTQWTGTAQRALTDPTWEGRKKSRLDKLDKAAAQLTIVKPFWTAAEFRSFERLSAMVCDPAMDVRQRARTWLKDFIDKHGKEKCDMMLAELRRRDELEWFKDGNRTKGA